MARLHITAALLVVPALTLLLACHQASSSDVPAPAPAQVHTMSIRGKSAPAAMPAQAHTMSIRGQSVPAVMHKMDDLGETKSTIPVFRVRTHPTARIPEKDLQLTGHQL